MNQFQFDVLSEAVSATSSSRLAPPGFLRLAGHGAALHPGLCDPVREVCPEFPGHPGLIHGSVPDPARAGNTDRQTYPAFQRTATELNERVAFLLERINPTDPSAPPKTSSLRSQRRSA